MRAFLLICLLVSTLQQILFTQIDAALANELQAEIEELQSEFEVAGLSVAVSFPDHSIWRGAAGRNSATTRITSDLLIGIASNTKTFTTVLILLLQEDGRLSLDDPIGLYLPPILHVDNTTTIRQLLQHTSGIYDFVSHPSYISTLLLHSTEIWSREKVFEHFVQAPYFAPGEGWAYSNTNYLLLGLILEKLSGKSIVDLLHERIFDPLQLDDTYFGIEEAIPAPMAHPWSGFLGGEGVDLFELGISINFACSTAWTGGAIVSTAEDMVRFSRALYADNLLTDASKAAMNNYWVEPDTVIGYDYGLGSMRHTLADGTILVGHSGNKVYRSFVSYSEADDISLAFLCNDDSFERPQMTESALRLLNIIRGYQALAIDELEAPMSWQLSPNPTQDRATLDVTLPKMATVSVKIYDSIGRLVKDVQQNTRLAAGPHRLVWTPITPGVYFWQLIVNGKVIAIRQIAR